MRLFVIHFPRCVRRFVSGTRFRIPRRHILLNSPMKFLSLLILLASCATAGEYALLSSGMRLRIDRHEQAGEAFILYSGAGSMKLASAEVTGFEAEEYVAP